MTVSIANTELSYTWNYWRLRTNELADAMTVKAVTVNSNAAVGNAFVTGTFRSNTLYTDTLSGGNNTTIGLLTVSTNTSFSANVVVVGTGTFQNTLAVVGAATLSNTLTVTGAITGLATANVTISLSVGNSSVFSIITPTTATVPLQLTVGNSSVNTTANSTYFETSNGQFDIGVAVGNSTVKTTITNVLVTSNGFVGSNATLSSKVTIGNATVNTSVSPTVVATTNVNAINITSNTYVGNTATFGNTVINTANVVSDMYYGFWDGANVAVIRGGTGTNTAPTSGQLLIGRSNGSYAVNTLSPGNGITYINGNGSITIGSKVAGLANGYAVGLSSNATSNVYTITNLGVTSLISAQAPNGTLPKTGDVVLTSNDVVWALGYLPGAANAALWLPANTDTYYSAGNVAIGFFVANTGPTAGSSNATFDVRTYTSGTLPVVLVENANSSSNTMNAMLDILVANTGAKSSVRFSRGTTDQTGWAKGSIEYRHSSDSFGIFTGGSEVITINGTVIGIGNTTPLPNEGGQGIHVSGTVPGFTLGYTGNGAFSWVMGINPAFNSLAAGARQFDSFGIYSDEAQSGLVWTGKTSATSFAVYTGNTKRVEVISTGEVGIGTSAVSGKILTVGGDIWAAGFQTTSDYRVKKNIEPIVKANERIRDLRPIWFDYINGPVNQEGFIAHELQQVVPFAVRGIKDGFEKQTVDYSKITPLLVASQKETLNIIDKQWIMINALQDEINGLKDMISEIKKK